MTNKENFIQDIENMIAASGNAFSPEGEAYFQELKASVKKPLFTKSGAAVLAWLQENYAKYNNVMSAKIIGEGMYTSSRAASGALRKLITDGYVTKIAGTPVCYSLTELGKNCSIPSVEEEET